MTMTPESLVRQVSNLAQGVRGAVHFDSHAGECVTKHKQEPLSERTTSQDCFEAHLLLALKLYLRFDLMSFSQVESLVLVIAVHTLQHI
jgi:hypothetical protein